MRNKLNAIEYVDVTYDDTVSRKTGLDRITWLAALSNEARANLEFVTTGELYHRCRTIAATSELLQMEAGELHFTGGMSIKLAEERQSAIHRVEAAEMAECEARAAYDKQQAALHNRGLVTKLNTQYAR